MAIETPAEQFASVTRKRRAAGELHEGTWHEGNVTSSTITASVQPVSGQDLRRLPEGTRTTDAVRIFSEDELRVGNETDRTPPDRVVYLGEEYEVTSVQRWSMGQLDHYDAMAVRAERTGAPGEEG